MFLTPQQRKIAYHKTEGRTPGVMFLGGFMSDMTGAKATALEQYCKERGQAFVRFDYSGHGRSEGAFADGTITRWIEDALAVFDHLTEGPQILIGSSMGGWIMTRLALARPDRIHALIGIAPGPDFTERLMWPQMTKAQQETLMRDGIIHVPTEYGDKPYSITKGLIESGRKESVLSLPSIPIHCPVRILQGMQDPDIPWPYAYEFAEKLESREVQVTLIKDGDHRLSRKEDIDLLFQNLIFLS